MSLKRPQIFDRIFARTFDERSLEQETSFVCITFAELTVPHLNNCIFTGLESGFNLTALLLSQLYPYLPIYTHIYIYLQIVQVFISVTNSFTISLRCSATLID